MATVDIRDIESFYYEESDALDQRRYRDWLKMLDDEIQYSIPIGRNVHSSDAGREYTRPGRDVLWFDEGKTTLTQRVVQLETGEHWAEEPVSRLTHIVTNVRVVGEDASGIEVSSRVLVYRNRVETETDLLVGRRTDTLVRVGNSFRVRKRVVLLNQSVLLAKNLTMFF